MNRAVHWYYHWKGHVMTQDEFRIACLVPACGEATSFDVIENLRFQLFATSVHPAARNSLCKYDSKGKVYINYDDYGLNFRLYYNYSDSSFDVFIVE